MNYSSAKSIFFTYRKEGRIVKKTAKNRVLKKDTMMMDHPHFMHEQQMQHNFWQPNSLRWFGNANSFFQNFSRPLLNGFAQNSVENSNNRIENQTAVSNIAQKPDFNWNSNQYGMFNNPFQQSNQTPVSIRPDTANMSGQDKKPSPPSFFSNFGKKFLLLLCLENNFY